MVKFYSQYNDINTLIYLIDNALSQLHKSYNTEKFLYFTGRLCNQHSEISIYKDYINLKVGNISFYFDNYEYDDLTKTLFLYHKRELIGELKC